MASESYVGGQAVIEGVMMKNKDKVVVAVREDTGKIITKEIKPKYKESKIPFVRGMINLVSMMSLGYNALEFSASVFNKEHEKTEKDWKYSVAMFFSLGFAIIMAIFLFKFLPLSTASLALKFLKLSNFWFNIVDGLMKIFIFVAYVYLISLMPDIRRVFEYHGAEHKAVACYEAKEKLTVENVKKYSTLHKRCGTTFIFFVLFVSIIVYVFIPFDYSFWAKLGLRLLLLPVIVSISYEILRLGARYKFASFLAYPGLAIQKITTREPDDKQIEVAITALKKVL
jgi:uncharacterized protein YqhQ